MIQNASNIHHTVRAKFKLKRGSENTEMSILDTFHSVHTDNQAVVPHSYSMHVGG